MKRILEVQQSGGQCRYRITENGAEIVPWQWGMRDVASTVEQARGRFFFDIIRVLP
jgi:hypothetical protein